MQLNSRDELSGVAPGVFRESRHAERVFFVEQMEGEANLVGNVFVRSLQHQREGVMVAKRGYQEVAPNGDEPEPPARGHCRRPARSSA